MNSVPDRCYDGQTVKRNHSIRIPVTRAEQRAAQRLAERLDVPLAQLLRKMLRDAARSEDPAEPSAVGP